jgi:adenosylhomocysteine nucleosidase
MKVQPPFVAVIVGLAFEARIARTAPSARVFCGRGPDVTDALNAALGPDCSGIISFGVAGGLDPSLRPGAQLVASAVVRDGTKIPTDEGWSRSLLRAHPGAVHAPIASVEEAVTDPSDKTRLFETTGAAAVDMESHIAADLAAKHSLPFAVLRVVADPATRHVPHSAMQGMRPDGRTDGLAVLRSLMRRPSEIADMIRIARDAWVARLALERSPQYLARSFALPDPTGALTEVLPLGTALSGKPEMQS